MVMGLVSGLSLVNHSDSGSFLMVYMLHIQDGFQQGGFWEVGRHVVSPFDLSRILLVGGGLLVLCSLPRLPVIKLFMQMVTIVPGHGGRVSPNNSSHYGKYRLTVFSLSSLFLKPPSPPKEAIVPSRDYPVFTNGQLVPLPPEGRHFSHSPSAPWWCQTTPAAGTHSICQIPSFLPGVKLC